MPQISCQNTDKVSAMDSSNLDTIFTGLDFSYNEEDVDSLSFTLLGCWNSYCANVLKGSFADSSSQRLTSKLLQSTKDDLNAKYLITAGDNHYDDPLEREDITSKQSIDMGFKCFNDIMDIPMFLSMGNHDVKTESILREQMKKTYDGSSMNADSVTFPSNWILPSSYYHLSHSINGAVVDFIFIDTNLIADKYYFDDTTHSGDTFKRDQSVAMMAWLKSKLETCVGIKCVIGHHPIFSVGHKNKRPIRREKTLEDIYNIMIKNEVHFYFCADEHNTQYLYDDDNDIHHIVSGGTGAGSGADNAYVHQNTTSDFHRPNRPIAIQTDQPNFRIRSVFTFSGPSIVNFKITKNDIKFDIIGVSENIVDNNAISINRLCALNYDDSVNLDNIKLNAPYDHHKIYFTKTIPRTHDLLFLLRCDAYTKKLNSTNLEEVVSTLRTNKIKLGYTTGSLEEVLNDLDAQIKAYKTLYKEMNILRINEEGVEVDEHNVAVN